MDALGVLLSTREARVVQKNLEKRKKVYPSFPLLPNTESEREFIPKKIQEAIDYLVRFKQIQTKSGKATISSQ